MTPEKEKAAGPGGAHGGGVATLGEAESNATSIALRVISTATPHGNEFKHYAPSLIANGYLAIPIKPGYKRPALTGWERARLAASDATRYPACGIGVLCGQGAHPIAAIDIDTTNADLAERFTAWCESVLGLTCARVGNAPKVLLVYRAPAPALRKATGAWFVDAAGDKHRVEVLGDGQQFVAYHVHPDTGAPYQWVDMLGGLEAVHASELPIITAEQIAEALDVFARLAVDAGLTLHAAASAAAARRVDMSSDDPLMAHEPPLGVSLAKARELLEHAAGADYDEWLHAGMSLHHEFSGSDEALDLWDEWSASASNYAGRDDIEKRWESFGRRTDRPYTLKWLVKRANDKAREAVQDEAAQLVERARSDPGAPFEAQALDTLRALRKADMAAFIRTRDALKRARVPVRDLDHAIRRDDALKTASDHLDVARAVRSALGADNVLYALGHFWRWQATGVWRVVDDRDVKQVAQATLEEQFGDAHPVTRSTVDSVVDVLKNDCHREGHAFDLGEPGAINVLNGELHLTDGTWSLRPHAREHYRTTQLAVRFDPAATAPRFVQFLEEVFAGDADASDKAALLCEAIGYSLLADCRFEKFVLLVGGGANGKSVVLSVVEALVGAAQVCAVQPSQFGNRFQRAHLHGKLVNIVTEIAEGAEIADAELKAIVSGELTTAEQKLRPPFDFKPFATCWFATNHMPHTRDFSDALFRRALIVPFNRRFDGVGCDPNLKDKLRAELPGILNMALDALARLIHAGRFTATTSSDAAKREWRLQSDQVAQFAEERCEVLAGALDTSQRLYAGYEIWAKGAGINRRVNRKTFTERLERLGIRRAKGTGGVRLLAGIRLLEEFNDFDAPTGVEDLV